MVHCDVPLLKDHSFVPIKISMLVLGASGAFLKYSTGSFSPVHEL